MGAYLIACATEVTFPGYSARERAEHNLCCANNKRGARKLNLHVIFTMYLIFLIIRDMYFINGDVNMHHLAQVPAQFNMLVSSLYPPLFFMFNSYYLHLRNDFNLLLLNAFSSSLLSSVHNALCMKLTYKEKEKKWISLKSLHIDAFKLSNNMHKVNFNLISRETLQRLMSINYSLNCTFWQIIMREPVYYCTKSVWSVFVIFPCILIHENKFSSAISFCRKKQILISCDSENFPLSRSKTINQKWLPRLAVINDAVECIVSILWEKSIKRDCRKDYL